MPHRSGFTLLEMSVVLVIIGLLIGSIVIAKSLTRAAQLQAVVTEYDIYLKAIQEFHDRYMALPGDMTRATELWGTQPGNCSPPLTTYTTPTTSTNTCNGDGNGRIGIVSSTTVDACSLSNPSMLCPYETYLAWQHLSNAGLIDGRYNGQTGAGQIGAPIEIGVNAPASSLKGAGWTIQYLLPPSVMSWEDLWDDQYGHVLVLGGAGRDPDLPAGQPVLTPKEALELDTKMDDGRPGTGTIRHWRSLFYYPHCVTNDTSQTAMTYDTSNATYADTLACTPLFVPGL